MIINGDFRASSQRICLSVCRCFLVQMDAEGWDFVCSSPHNGRDESIKWFVPDGEHYR